MKLIKFWAEWCIPCHKTEPIFASIEAELGDRLEFERANVDEHPAYAALYGVRSVPTLLLVDALGIPVRDLTPLAAKKEALRAELLALIDGSI